MDFVALLLFLIMQYVRPQEWSATFNSLRPVQVLAVIAVFAIFQRRQPVKRKDLWSSPIDYIVTAYFVWTVFASYARKDTFTAIFPLVFFYFIGVLTLNSLQRIKTFLSVWAASIVFVAALAIASKFGFDPLDSARLTDGVMKGRLILNLSIFNNPNALGHALVPSLAMLYYLLFWKRTFAKVLLVVIIIPITAILMTASKGAFVSAAATIFVALTFGRPKTVQVTLAVLAFTFGGTMIYALPRMNELQSSKTDEAIQGRIAAYRFGMQQMERLTRGHGLGNFTENFFKHGPLRRERYTQMGRVNNQSTLIVRYRWVHYGKAPHSAYVQNGSDLGYTGFFIFIGILYACGRTLVTAKTINNDEERVRRMLFAILVWFAVSSWMVDFCYRATFFFLAAAASAFHRYLRGQLVESTKANEEEELEDSPPPLPSPWQVERIPAGSGVQNEAMTIDVSPVSVETVSDSAVAVQTMPEPAVVPQIAPEVASAEVSPVPALHGTVNWERFGLIDLAMTYLFTSLAIRFWRYIIHNF